MTHLRDHAKPNRSFMLIKIDRNHVREGDTIIFQEPVKTDLGDGLSFDDIKEQTVKVTHVDIGCGLKMGWQLIGWEDVV